MFPTNFSITAPEFLISPWNIRLRFLWGLCLEGIPYHERTGCVLMCATNMWYHTDVCIELVSYWYHVILVTLVIFSVFFRTYFVVLVEHFSAKHLSLGDICP